MITCKSCKWCQKSCFGYCLCFYGHTTSKVDGRFLGEGELCSVIRGEEEPGTIDSCPLEKVLPKTLVDLETMTFSKVPFTNTFRSSKVWPDQTDEFLFRLGEKK